MEKKRIVLLSFLVILLVIPLISAETFTGLKDNIDFSYKLTDKSTYLPVEITTKTSKELWSKSYKINYEINADENFKSLVQPKFEVTSAFTNNIQQFSEYSFGYYTIETKPKLQLYKDGKFFITKNEEILTKIIIDWTKEAVNSKLTFKIDKNKLITTIESKDLTQIDLLKARGGIWEIDPILSETVISDWSTGTFTNTINASGNLFLKPDAALSMNFNTNSLYNSDLLGHDQSYYANNGAITAPSLGLDNQSFSFDGVDDYAKTNSNIVIAQNASASMSLWAYRYPSTGEDYMVSMDDVEFTISYSGNIMYFYSSMATGISNYIQLTNPLPNAWEHFVLVRNETDILAYIDGNLKSTLSQGGLGQRALNHPLNIGDRTSLARAFNGSISSVQLFNKTLTNAEVLAINNSGRYFVNTTDPNLVAGYALNKTYYNKSVLDLSASNNNADMGAFYTSDRNGAVQFDGVNDYINGGNNPSLNLPIDFSVSVWFKTTMAGTGAIVGKRSTATTPFNYLIYITAGNVIFNIHDGTNNVIGGTAPTTYNDNLWHHIACVRDVTADRLYIYIDNVLKQNFTDTTTGSITSAQNVLIGAMSQSIWSFNGSIDDAQIYNRALSADEIYCLYNNTNCPAGWVQNNTKKYFQTGNWTSTTTYDSGVNETIWTNITLQGSFNNETIKAYTRTSKDNITWSEWVMSPIMDLVTGVIELVNQIGRYLEVKLEISTPYANETAIISNMTLTFELYEPLATIITPTDNQKFNGWMEITWDINGTSTRTDIWIKNSTNQYNLSYNQTQTNKILNYNFQNLNIWGLYNLTVNSCENATTEYLCGNDTAPIELVRPSCSLTSYLNTLEFGTSQTATWGVLNYTGIKDVYLNITDSSDGYLYLSTGNTPAIALINHLSGTGNITCYVNTSYGLFQNTTQFSITSIPPIVSITNPTNTTYTTTSITLQAVETDTTLNTCWYSIDEGATNTTFTCNTDQTPAISQGNNHWYVWANDSVNEIGTDNISFFVDNINPVVIIDYPISTTYNYVVSTFNFSAHDTNLNTCWYSTDGLTSTIITCGANITGLTASEGSNIWYAYANDTLNNVHSDSVIFVVDTTPPTEPTPSYSFLSDTSIQIDFTTNENSNYTMFGDVSTSSSSFTLSHTSTHIGLSQNSTYSYNLTLCDNYYNCADYSGYNFTTKTTPISSSGDSGWMIAIVLAIGICGYLLILYYNTISSEGFFVYVKSIVGIAILGFIPLLLTISINLLKGITSFDYVILQTMIDVFEKIYIISIIIFTLILFYSVLLAIQDAVNFLNEKVKERRFKDEKV